MLDKEIIIQTDKTKSEIISLLNKHVEPWEKDNTNFVFEGKVLPSGEFNLAPMPYRDGFKTRSSQVKVNGNIIESGSVTIINIKLTPKKLITSFMYITSIISVVCAILLYLSILPVKIPWFIALFYPIFNIIYYFILRSEIKAVEQKLLFLRN